MRKSTIIKVFRVFILSGEGTHNLWVEEVSRAWRLKYWSCSLPLIPFFFKFYEIWKSFFIFYICKSLLSGLSTSNGCLTAFANHSAFLALKSSSCCFIYFFFCSVISVSLGFYFFILIWSWSFLFNWSLIRFLSSSSFRFSSSFFFFSYTSFRLF